MAYCTIADLQARADENVLINLSDDDDTGAVNETVLQAVIDQAAEEMDAILSTNYTVPITGVDAKASAALKSFNASWALQYLYNRREKPAPSSVETRAKFALEFLTAVAEGKRNLPNEDLPDAAKPQTHDIGSEASRAPDIFGDGTAYESEWLQDVESDM